VTKALVSRCHSHTGAVSSDYCLMWLVADGTTTW